VRHVDEVTELQPYATLFLKNFLRDLNLDVVFIQGQESKSKLVGQVYIADETNSPVLKTATGYADLLVFAYVSEALHVVEFKAHKFVRGLYHSASAPKAPTDFRG
jgi:hypothetical protein